jgi:hypothetical protein
LVSRQPAATNGRYWDIPFLEASLKAPFQVEAARK